MIYTSETYVGIRERIKSHSMLYVAVYPDVLMAKSKVGKVIAGGLSVDAIHLIGARTEPEVAGASRAVNGLLPFALPEPELDLFVAALSDGAWFHQGAWN